MNAQRCPLTWPVGWRRTSPASRLRAKFLTRRGVQTDTSYRFVTEKLTVMQATVRLETELRRLGAVDELLSTNVALRLDGRPRSDQGEPKDPGAAIYFKLLGKPRTLACDRWDRVADNIAAIAAHVDAIRAVDRYGVGTLEQAFGGYTALPPATVDWWLILGVERGATLEEAELAFKRLVGIHHPDLSTSSPGMMARLTEARAAARKELGG